jgi:poly-gamma-glutamate capsule biosynthesis protein CapA/YwtB (metallophosphatase superfamily)
MDGKVTMTAAGDIVVRHRLYANGASVNPRYEATLEYLRAGELRWASCEVQFARAGYRTDAPIAYLVDPEVALDLGRAGFEVMTVATNHTCDFGPDAFMESLGHMRRAGIAPVGGGKNLDEAFEPFVCERNGLRIGLLAVSCLVPPDYAALDSRPGIAPARVEQWQELHPILLATEPGAPIPMRSRVAQDDQAEFLKKVEKLRPTVDVLIASVHWGYGRGTPLAEYQRPFGHSIIDAGADFVLGNHAHSPAGVEVYRGKPIIYSLGNHIAQQDRVNATPVQREIFTHIDPWSMICAVKLTRAGVTGIEFRVTECDQSGMPILLEDASRAAPVLRSFREISEAFGTTLTIDGSTAWLEVA